jgi:hypothetical protein
MGAFISRFTGGSGSGANYLEELLFSSLQELTDDTVSPTKVTSLPNYIFYINSGIETINLSGVTSVENYSLYGMKDLKTATFSNIETLPVGGFIWGNSSHIPPLTSINIPKVTVLPASTFVWCTSLATFDFSNITDIGYSALGYTAFTSLYLPNIITISGSSIMGLAENSTLASVDMGSSVSSINSTAFSHCNALTTININRPPGAVSGAPWGATNATVHWTVMT